jgi:tetratricopeptide (TPR) repeat protein
MPSLRNLVCLAASLLVFSGAGAQTPDDRGTMIVAALRDQEYDKALHLLDAALKESPLDAKLWTMQGVAYEGEGRKKEALAAFRHALKVSPDAIPALEKVAQIEYDAGDPEGIPVLEHLLRLRPGDRTSHGMLAVLQYQQGNCAAAVDHFERAAPLFDSQLPALHAYGTCLVKLKEFDKAAEVFDRGLALNAGDSKERQVVASVQLLAHQPARAIATLDPLLQTGQDAQALELASGAYEDLHNTEKAVEALRQAILLDPHNVNLYVDFAALSASHQSFQVGIDAVNDGINIQPNAATLYFARGVLYVQLAKYDAAQADFERAYDLDPSQSLSVAAQGLAAAQQNNLGDALAGIQEKLGQRPDDPLLLYIQADILLEQGAEPGSADFETAMRSAKRAIELRPSLGPAHGVLAKLYLKAGLNAEAAVQCRKTLEIDPNDQAAVYHLIQALRKSNKQDQIPPLLKQLAVLRQQATKDEREQYRYKLVEGEDLTR